jgi:hypothetical protein
LVVVGVGKTSKAHLFEHPTDAFPEFLAEVEVSSNTGNAGITSEASDLQGVIGIGNAREPARAFDLNSIVEDLDADVVTADAVGAMNDGIDECLKPSILGDEPDPLEASRGGQRPAGRQPIEDGLAALGQLLRDGPLNPDVIEEFLARAGAPFGTSIPQDPDEGFREPLLRVPGEE